MESNDNENKEIKEENNIEKDQDSNEIIEINNIQNDENKEEIIEIKNDNNIMEGNNFEDENNFKEENEIQEKKNTEEDNENKNIIISESENLNEKENQIKTDKNNLEKTSEKLKNVPVYIQCAKKIEINNIPVLIYFIKGKLVQKEIIRSYNDFEIFHQSLVNMWPCICIPDLPFKQTISETKPPFIFPEIKMKLLNHFFKKLSESNELLTSESTKIFLCQDKNFTIKLFDLKANDYKEISERYLKVFTYYVEDQKITKEKESFINRFFKLLDISLKKLNEIGFSIETEIYNIKREQNAIEFVNTMFIDLEKSIPNTKRKLATINDVVKPLKSVSIYL